MAMSLTDEDVISSIPNAEKIQSPVVNLSKCAYSQDLSELTAKVLVIYTGGTIGMVNSSGAYKPVESCMENKLKDIPFFNSKDDLSCLNDDDKEEYLVLQSSLKDKRIVLYKILEFTPLLDSSNMGISDWIKISQCIQDNYYSYDGFVVLHGTDTMAYTASALSFMCENLGKPIVLTGSQLPLYETRSDGRENLLSALIVAGNYNIPEVMICFGEKVLRGNRSSKLDSAGFSAFSSPNMPPLISLKTNISVDWPAVFRPSALEKFRIETKMCPNVCLLRLFPGLTVQTVRAFLQPPVQGVVVQTFGAGNAPTREDLLTLFRDATQWGVLIVNISQCVRGDVSTAYETGKALQDAGLILGGDMTPEAALCKLYYVLGKDEWSMKKKRNMLARSLRGEMTVMSEAELTISDHELIDGFAMFMHLSTTEEIVKVKNAIYPSLMCSAARANDIPGLKKLRESGGNLNAENYEERTALHVACRMGHANAVHYLLNHGVSVHAKDCRGDTPLVDAIEGGHIDIIKILVQTGAYLMLPEEYVAVKMCSAAAKNDESTISAWLAAGADPNSHDYDRRTALHVAVSMHHCKIAQALIEKGALVDLEDINGMTARSLAKNLNFCDMTELFSKKDEQAGDIPEK